VTFGSQGEEEYCERCLRGGVCGRKEGFWAGKEIQRVTGEKKERSIRKKGNYINREEERVSSENASGEWQIV